MAPTGAAAQQLPLDSLLKAHTYPIQMDRGRLSGAGLDALLAAAAGAQFVMLAEEHNVGPLADFSAALFDTLHHRFGFNYAAFEQGGVITRWLGRAAKVAGRDSVSALARRWPHAPTFASDQELDMIAHMATVSAGRHDAVWGIDQEFGALHILERLAELAPSPAARTTALDLASIARRYEARRGGDTLFLAQVAVPADYAGLTSLFQPAPGSEAEFLITSLQRTNRIYHNNTLAQRGEVTAYENSREREASLKARFMDEYRRAQAAGDSVPRALLKLGHWHLFRGIYRGNITTFGTFAGELAIANGMDSFLLSTYAVDGPDRWRNSAAFAPYALPEVPFTFIDFRPLRPYAHQNRIAELSEAWKALFFRAEGALIMRGAGTGTYRVTQGQP